MFARCSPEVLSRRQNVNDILLGDHVDAVDEVEGAVGELVAAEHIHRGVMEIELEEKGTQNCEIGRKSNGIGRKSNAIGRKSNGIKSINFSL